MFEVTGQSMVQYSPGALVNSSIREPVYGTLPMEFFALLTLELWETYT